MVTTFFKTSLVRQFQQLRHLNLIVERRLRERPLSQNKKIIGLYDASNLESCPWPKTEDGEYIRKFLTPLIKKGISPFVKNVKTDLRALVCGELVFPITINNAEYENSYVCSPYSYFISYAQEESLAHLAKNWILQPIRAFIWAAEKIFKRFKINKVVIVNNWFYSTNLYPACNPQQIQEIVHFLKNRFPDCAIVFRSIDSHLRLDYFKTLQELGFTLIASRQIFFIRPWKTTLFESRLFKSDLKLLENSGYEVIDGKDLLEQEIPRLIELYNALFIEKFSALNPQFTEEFVRLALNENILHFKALKKGGRIDGVVGFVQRNEEMFCPFFGYDRSLPHEISLYRLLSTVLMLEAERRHLFFHQSSGASMFKKIRKASSCIEYMAVYDKHLHFLRRIPWKMLDKMCNSLGIVLMKRY